MALHRVSLPKAAANLFRVVAFQKRLLKALADPALDPKAIDAAWVQNVRRRLLTPEWVRRFCLDGQEDRIRAIAAATLTARRALYEEFCRQNRRQAWPTAGGNFQDLSSLPGFNAVLAEQVKVFFERCYKLLSHDKNRRWLGYEFRGGRVISNRSYKEDFCGEPPTNVVCPYCDGEIGTPELDHYLAKSRFPLLACSPWNLLPVCHSCNNAVTGKGDNLMITLGPPYSTADWLHPFFRPATDHVRMRLDGAPKKPIPQLHSPDASEQRCLDSHTSAIPSLPERWERKAAAYYAELVRTVRRRNAIPALDSIVKTALVDCLDERGKSPSSMVKAAVCQAVLDLRPEFIEEFTAPSNAPGLA